MYSRSISPVNNSIKKIFIYLFRILTEFDYNFHILRSGRMPRDNKKKSCRYYAGAMNIFCWHVVNCGCDSRSRHSESFIKSRRVDLSSVVTAPVDWITMRVPPPVVKTVFIHWSWWADEMTDFMVLCVCMTTWKNRNILDIFFRASPNIGGHTGYVVDHDL